MTRLSFASSFGSSMVLQQAPAAAAVWGFAPSASAPAILLALSVASVPIVKVQATTSAFNDTALIWHAQLTPVASVFDTSGNPFTYSLTVTSDDGLNATIGDVIFGEVWVCSGQSNMAFLVEMAMNGQTLVEEAGSHGAQVRLFTTRKLTAASPLLELGQDTNGGLWTRGVELPWSRASRKTISDDGAAPSTNDDNWLYMSAVCYLFGLEINRARGVPVGLINTNWGGTQIEDWMPQQAIDDCSHGSSDANGSLPEVRAPRVATHLYNAMISPLLNQTIKGAIWYQGESNSARPADYSCQLPAMVKHWRAGWAAGSPTDPNFPFGVVQLAGNLGDPLQLPIFRFVGQTQSTGVLPTSALPNSFLATAYDLGDAASPFGAVHCRYKTDVGARLALGARRLAYEEYQLHVQPVFESARASTSPDGAVSVTLAFTDTGAKGLALLPMKISEAHDMTNWTGTTPFEVCTPPSLTTAEGHALFEPCGANDTSFAGWRLAPTTTLGAGGDTIVLGGLATKPMAVRFAWRAYPCEFKGCGVASAAEGIPPPPFWALVEMI